MADVVECKELRMVDSEGRTRIMLSMFPVSPTGDRHQPMIELFDETERPRIQVGLAANEHGFASLLFQDGNISIGVGERPEDGSVGITIRPKSQNRSYDLSVSPSGELVVTAG